MENQTVDPGVNQNLVVLYNKNASSNAGTQPQLFMQIPQFLPNAIPNDPMQLTYNTVNTSGPQYQSFLAGGYLFYTGSLTTAAGTTTITLTTVPTKLLVVIPAIHGVFSGVSNYLVATTIISNSQFSITVNSVASFVTWIAIGSV